MKKQLKVGSILSTAWEAVKSQIWVLVGVSIVYMIITYTISILYSSLFSSDITAVGIFAYVLNMFISILFTLGYTKNIFQALDNFEPQVSAYAAQIRNVFTYLGASIVYTLIVFLSSFMLLLVGAFFAKDMGSAAQATAYFVQNMGIILLVLFILVLPSIYMSMRLQYYTALIIEEDAGAIESLKKSWEITKGHTGFLIRILLVNVGLIIAGTCLFLIGIFIAIPLTYAVYCESYRKLNPMKRALEDEEVISE